MKLTFILGLFLFSTALYAQKEDCGAFPSYFQVLRSFPVLEKKYGFQKTILEFSDDNRAIKVKVHVHVLFRNNTEKVPKEKIDEQIAILNKDFKGANDDIGKIPNYFRNDAAGDCKIKFELAKVDYIQTNKTEFVLNYDTILSMEADPIKFTSLGGHDGAPSNQYLNIWIGNIKKKKNGKIGSLAGYATPPGGINMYDGVVLNYRYIGYVPNSSYNKGRTATHEVGHWLDLLHISGNGEDQCGNDFVDDTPTQQQQNFNCPVDIKENCSHEQYGEMYMNYLDYVNDSCMVMFSNGQRKRMRGCFFDLTKRGSLLSFSSMFNLTDSIPILFDSSAALINSMEKKSNKVVFTWENILERTTVAKQGNYSICLRELATEDCVEANNIKGNMIAVTGLKPGALYEIVIKTRINGKDLHQPYPFIFQADNKLPDNRKKPVLQAQ